MNNVPPALPARRKNNLRLALLAVLAFLLPLLLYLPTLRYDFVDLDDGCFVVQNPMVTGGLSLESLKKAFFAPGPAPMYIPVLWGSYMLDVSVLGKEAWAFHLTNALLHALNSLLLFFLLRQLSKRHLPGLSPAAPFLLALLWSLHPLRIESVAWITERKDCLSAFFALLVLLAWLPAVAPDVSRRRRFAFASLSLVLFVLGMLAKPSLAPLPVLLALLAWPPMRRRPRLVPLVVLLLPFFAAAVLPSLATVSLHAVHNGPSSLPLIDRLATVPSIVFFYVSKFLLPRGLALLYPKWTSPVWFGALLGLPLLLVAVWVFLRRNDRPLLWFGALFAVLFLLPVVGLMAVPFNLVADRYTFLPAIGVSIALLPFFSARPGRSARFPLVLLAAVVAAYALAAVFHLPSWRNSDACYLSSRRYVPDHPTIRAYDACVARRHGDFAVARACAARAYQIVGTSIAGEYSLFLADIPSIRALHGPETALELLRQWPPSDTNSREWADLACAILLDLGRDEEALQTALDNLDRVPYAESVRAILLHVAMIASYRLGNLDDALRYGKLSGLVPKEVTAPVAPHVFLTYYIYLWNNHDREPALRYFRELVADCDNPAAINNIAWIVASSFYSPGDPSEPVGFAQKALSLLPEDSTFRPSLLDTLAVAQANAGDFPAAIETLSSALALLPPSASSRPAMERRLSLFRRGLPYREINNRPVPPEEYGYDPHL